MADGITFHYQESLREFERKMNALEEKIAKRVAVAAIRRGRNVLKKAVVAAARTKFEVRTGTLWRNVKVALRIKGRGVLGAVVRAYVYLGSDAFYGRFFETGGHWIGRGKGRRARFRRGALAGRPFRREWMAPAAEAAFPAVQQAVVEELQKGVESNVAGGSGE